MKEKEYSKTPLSKKLGLKPGYKIQIYNTPKTYTSYFHNCSWATTKNDISKSVKSFEKALSLIHNP